MGSRGVDRDEHVGGNPLGWESLDKLPENVLFSNREWLHEQRVGCRGSSGQLLDKLDVSQPCIPGPIVDQFAMERRSQALSSRNGRRMRSWLASRRAAVSDRLATLASRVWSAARAGTRCASIRAESEGRMLTSRAERA